MKIVALVLLLGVLGLGLWAWSRTSAPPGAGPPTAEEAAPAPPAGGEDVVVERGEDPGIEWTVPARWREEAPRPVRHATYSVPAAAGDPLDGSCGVFYFGPGQGGDAAANVERWIGEFEEAAPPRRALRRVGGLAVTTVFVRGTHAAHADMGGGGSAAAPDFALLGAIVEGPAGNLFFKLTGPARTIVAAEAEFDALIGSLRVKPAAR